MQDILTANTIKTLPLASLPSTCLYIFISCNNLYYTEVALLANYWRTTFGDGYYIDFTYDGNAYEITAVSNVTCRFHIFTSN